jgi:hypothetical protein
MTEDKKEKHFVIEQRLTADAPKEDKWIAKVTSASQPKEKKPDPK